VFAAEIATVTRAARGDSSPRKAADRRAHRVGRVDDDRFSSPRDRLAAGTGKYVPLASSARLPRNRPQGTQAPWQAEEDELTYGVRLQFSEGSSPPVKVVPFRIPAVPVIGCRSSGTAALRVRSRSRGVDYCRGRRSCAR